MKSLSQIIDLLEGMLAPTMMVIACGLLLLGMGMRYSAIVARIRTLNQEKRQLMIKNIGVGLVAHEQERINVISAQVSHSFQRLRYSRNSYVLMGLAIVFFIFTSLSIGLYMAIGQKIIHTFILAFFLIGIVVMLYGVFFAISEVSQGFKILSIEVRGNRVLKKEQNPIILPNDHSSSS